MSGIISIVIESLFILSNNIIFVILGVAIGMFLGILPGMGGAIALAIMVPFTLEMNSTSAFILLSAAMGATSFAGSITAILVNAPGTAANAATVLDGYKLTRQGYAMDALGASAVSSAAGAMISIFFFVLLIPVLRELALLFGSVEIFWLALFGLAIIPAVTRGGLTKGLIAGGLGLLFAYHGTSILTGTFRFEYILAISEDGIELVPALIGLFAIGEMLNLVSRKEGIVQSEDTEDGSTIKGSLSGGMFAVVKHPGMFLRSVVTGFFVGAIPGIGGTVANILAYSQASQFSEKSDKFGTGIIEGVIASESANDSKDGGQLIPTLGLGIPGSGSTAVLLGAFTLHGFLPGPRFISEQLTIVVVIALTILFSNILTSIIGVILAKWLVLLTRVDMSYLYPAVIALTLFAAFSFRNNFGDVIFAVIFGFIGFAFILLNINRIPVIIALVLGEIIEQNFHRVSRLGDGIDYFFSSPLAIILAAGIGYVLLSPFLQYLRPRISKGTKQT